MLVFPLFLGLILWVFGASLTGQSITLPPWVAASLETRITSSMGPAGVRLSGAELRFDREGTANLVLRDVALRDAKGTPLGVLNELGAKFNPVALLRPSEPPSKLHVSGAQITVRRSNDGAFSLSLGGAGGAEAQSLADTLDMIDSLFSQAPLSGIAEIAATDVTIILEDARSARIWHATNGTITLRNSPERVEIDVFSEVFNGTENLARVQLSFGSAKGARTAEISASLVNAAAADLALQSRRSPISPSSTPPSPARSAPPSAATPNSKASPPPSTSARAASIPGAPTLSTSTRAGSTSPTIPTAPAST